jgi:GNAT superfamily N-acetyltransferase
VAVWIPPGGSEFTEDQETEVLRLIEARLGAEPRNQLEQVFEQFTITHPNKPPHYYLSLLGTHPDWRGRGLGIGLLRATLAEIDAEGVPTYLESSNSGNDRRYEAVGYREVVRFTLPAGQVVAGMWREVGG